MSEEVQAAEQLQDEPVTAEGDIPTGKTSEVDSTDAPPADDTPPKAAQDAPPAEDEPLADIAPHVGVSRLVQAQGLPEVGADEALWEGYNPPAGSILRFKSTDGRTMRVVMLTEGRGLAAQPV